MLVSDVITSALSRIGVIPIGGAIPAEWTTLAITELNSMLQHWAAINLLASKVVKTTHTLTAGTAIYTVGASGEAITLARPTALRAATISLNSVETPCDIYPSLDTFVGRLKSQRGRPAEVHYDPGITQGVLALHPIPDGAYTLALWGVSSLTAVTVGTDTVAVPAEYDYVVKVVFAAHVMTMWGKQDDFLAREALFALGAVTPKGMQATLTPPSGS